jgi:hypothetical protein
MLRNSRHQKDLGLSGVQSVSALIWTVQRCTFLSLAIDSFVPSPVLGFGVKASKDILDLIASYLITQALQSDSL